ncbi:hypothetical protein APS56_04855 [Pseudalgibacter alginicilyticus]|uniref:Uncharacterized protein n=1 Tax=Pseudalgibacter alginicilyticus TaxID=1736674 RepID=A0A0P0CEG0_9FLAO|nr:hypothetical protein [Pseudalgibacter alginicilyticus]ALJ04509.1 hypothetical protein APS56_04855 [Pseudalgibacter alginicilyticus]
MKKTEICLHCNDDYTPTRRGVQKFCSKSCKSRYWYLKQNYTKEVAIDTIENKVVNSIAKVDKMSLAGVGNAAAGAAVVEVVKTVFTAQDNKPATKKDIQELKTLITGRYLPVNNAAKDAFGRSPFYDVETGNVVFR